MPRRGKSQSRGHAGNAEMAARITERKAIIDALARETDDFRLF